MQSADMICVNIKCINTLHINYRLIWKAWKSRTSLEGFIEVSKCKFKALILKNEYSCKEITLIRTRHHPVTLKAPFDAYLGSKENLMKNIWIVSHQLFGILHDFNLKFPYFDLRSRQWVILCQINHLN